MCSPESRHLGSPVMARPKIVGRIVTRLLRQIASGQWRPGQMLPPSRELARQFGLAQGTMQAALRELGAMALLDVRPRRRITVLPDAGQRAQSLIAERMAQPAARRLGILVPERMYPLVPNSYFGWMVDRIIREAKPHDISIKVIKWPLRDQVRTAESFLHREYGAALCIGVSPAYLISLLLMHEHEFPVLLYNRRFPELKLPTVRNDVFTAVRRVTDHLIGYGHRRIHLVTHHEPGVMQTQVEWINDWLGYLDEKDLLESSALPVSYIPRDRDPCPSFRSLIAEPTRATALIFAATRLVDQFFADDALGAIRIPEELSVMTFGTASQVPQEPWRPPITTVDDDVPRIAQCIIETVGRLLGGELMPPSIRIPMKIDLTASIGKAPDPKDAPPASS